MIARIIILSLQIAAIYIVFSEGNILSPVRAWIATTLDRAVGKKWSKYIQKPLWDCLPCMSGLWTIILTWGFDLFLILAVCGLNAIIKSWIEPFEPLAEIRSMDFGADQAPTLHRWSPESAAGWAEANYKNGKP